MLWRRATVPFAPIMRMHPFLAGGRRSLKLFALGTLRVQVGDHDVTDALPQKAKALLIYAARVGRPVGREPLAELLWEDQPPARSSGSLRMALSRLRDTVGDALEITRTTVETIGWTDANAFEDALRSLRPELTGVAPLTVDSAERLDETLRLYAGDFLHGFYVPGSSAFDDWQSNQREALRLAFVDAASLLIDYRQVERAYADGLALATRLLGVDPFREETHRQVMRLHATSGDRASALKQYDACRALLDDELGVEPDDETQTLYQQILDGTVAAAPRTVVVAVPPAPDRPLHNLPARITSFIGRDDALAAVKTLFDSARLITLVGPGGIGKTQLALETARHLLPALDDGAFFVDLAPARLPEQVADYIYDALGLRDSANKDVVASLERTLRERELLLVLDNFEHLLDASPLVDRLLRAAPGLRLLATSREPLNLYGEHVYAVPPLSRAAAAMLFRERALAARPSLSLDDESTTSAICERLEGLPLAVELAAGQAARMSLGNLLHGLDNRLSLLRTRARNLPPRQQTLYGAIDWSYELLSEAERAIYRRLAVFVGGWTADSARAVCDADDFALDELVGKSLLRRQFEPEDRYFMLEMIREHAGAKLAEECETAKTAEKHALYFYESARAAAQTWRTAAETGWFDWLDEELENLRAALHWLDITPGYEREHALMVGALGWFWYRRNHNAEAIRHTWRALARYDEPELLADVLAGGGHSAYEIGDLDLARAWHGQALAYYQQLGDRPNESFMYFCLATHNGNVLDAQDLTAKALSIAREVGDVSLQIFCLYSLGLFSALTGDYSQSVAVLDEALMLCRAHRLGYEADFLSVKAVGQLTQGDIQAALLTGQEARRVAIENQLDTVYINAMRTVSKCLFMLNRLSEAEAAAYEAYEQAVQLNYRSEMAGALRLLALFAELQDDLVRMRRFYRQVIDLDGDLIDLETFDYSVFIAHIVAVLAERGQAAAAEDLFAHYNRSLAQTPFVPGAFHLPFLDRIARYIDGSESMSAHVEEPHMSLVDLFAYAVSLLDLLDRQEAGQSTL